MTLYAKDAHKRAAKIVGYALTIGTPDAWHGVSGVLSVRLSEAERASMAYAVLRSLDAETAHMAASAALHGTLDGEAV